MMCTPCPVRRLPMIAAVAMMLTAPATAHDRCGVPENTPYDYGVLGPPTMPAIFAGALDDARVPNVPGPLAPASASIAARYRSPAFGIVLLWVSVPPPPKGGTQCRTHDTYRPDLL